MASFSRPASPGKPSVLDPRVSHFLSLGVAFLATADVCVPVAARAEPYARRVFAFVLHQACEAFLNALLAALTPSERRRLREEADIAAMRSHDLAQLRAFAVLVCPDVRSALPVEEAEDARLFDLLESSYARSRYSTKRFHLPPVDASRLLERVKRLGETAAACIEKVRGEVRS